MILRKLPLMAAVLLFASCSNMQTKPSYERMPAEETNNCQDLVKSLFMKENFKEDLNQALIDKKLLKYTSKFAVVQHPKMDWMNRARASLNRSLKNWNNNKYPAFYVMSEEDVVTEAKRYFQTVSSMVNADVVPAPEASKNLEVVTGWMKSFESYQKEVDNLLDERISLQYNLKVLKKFKQTDDVQDIKLVIKRNGELKEEVLTLRKSDKDIKYQITRLENEIKELDGTILSNGKIKDRLIRQAALNDMLTITQREFEYGIKNTDGPHAELTLELEKLNELLARQELKPTTYGIYGITNKIFIQEAFTAAKQNWIFKNFVQSPTMKFYNIFNDFIKNRINAGAVTDEEKVGIFKRIYSKVTSITPKQLTIGGGSVVVLGVGFERYFAVREKPDVIEQKDPSLEDTDSGKNEIINEAKKQTVDEQKHQEQLDRTKKEDTKRTGEHSEVIEVQINELVD